MKTLLAAGIRAKIANGVHRIVNREFLKKVLPRFVKYFFVGLLCALVNWSVFYALNDRLKVYYLFAATVSWATGTLLNFTLSCVIFKSKENRKKRTAFVMVILSDTIGLSIDLSVTAFCVEILGLPNIISKIAGTGVAFIFNFSSRQFFIFSHKRKQD
jgi:putative flippase GtrA